MRKLTFIFIKNSSINAQLNYKLNKINIILFAKFHLIDESKCTLLKNQHSTAQTIIEI